MKKLTYLSILIFCTLNAWSQLVPQPSPSASLSQTIGITKVEVNYSRPGVKGRKIFGGLLPYGKVWRTGANDPTLIRFSTNVKVNDQLLKAGTYAILSFPFANEWVIVFSENLQSTEANYDEDFDVLRIATPSYDVGFTETFTIDFSNIQYDQAYMNIYWENVAVTLDITVDNEATVSKSIEQKTLESAGAFLQAAEYFVNQGLSLETALIYANHSINLKESFRNIWIKSRILRGLGQYQEALQLAQKAKQLGKGKPVYTFFEEAIEKAIIDLKLLNPQGE